MLSGKLTTGEPSVNQIQPRRRFVIADAIAESTTSNGNHYVLCRVEGSDGYLAIWGTPGKNMRNIETFRAALAAGRPVNIESEWIHPTNQHWEEEQRHSFWIYERFSFRVIPN
jgi:hypothetical protein